MIKRLSSTFILLLLGLQSLPASPDVLILVHGFLGSAQSWEQSGINSILQTHGWKRAGVVNQVGLIPTIDYQAEQKVYSVELPSMAPIAVQSDYLSRQLSLIQAIHPDQPVVLVGHSAGGVVVRHLLVRHGLANAKALITIASPHLGTGRALEALEATDDLFPISMLKDIFAGELYDVVRDSWGVLLDLTPAYPGTMLYWLNQQPHPDIAYISIMRSGPVGLGDELVPSFSQDMNNVYALSGKAETHSMPVSHSLQSADGVKLVEILQAL
jgi:pimeloyl-ACP methyl ester carboxylesterase